MTPPSLTEARPTDRVAAEIARYGSLKAAISGLVNDSDGAPWTAPIHDILKEALAYRRALGTNARAA